MIVYLLHYGRYASGPQGLAVHMIDVLDALMPQVLDVEHRETIGTGGYELLQALFLCTPTE